MSLFSSKEIFRRITEISIEFLKEKGISGLLLDVDNTLSTHHGTVLVDGLEQWLDTMQKNGIRMAVVSNSKQKRVEPFAKKIGLPFVSLALKPLPVGYRRGVKLIGVPKASCAIIGDQIFTDVLGANLYGIKSLLVRPVQLESGISFRIRRYFEKKILQDKF